jgi:hypothetical protein
MRKFTAIMRGKVYRSKSCWLKECPKCQVLLYANKYKDLRVSMLGEEYKKSIGVSIIMEFCPECKELYVRHDY